jgi:hypothetical protein
LARAKTAKKQKKNKRIYAWNRAGIGPASAYKRFETEDQLSVGGFAGWLRQLMLAITLVT